MLATKFFAGLMLAIFSFSATAEVVSIDPNDPSYWTLQWRRLKNSSERRNHVMEEMVGFAKKNETEDLRQAIVEGLSDIDYAVRRDAIQYFAERHEYNPELIQLAINSLHYNPRQMLERYKMRMRLGKRSVKGIPARIVDSLHNAAIDYLLDAHVESSAFVNGLFVRFESPTTSLRPKIIEILVQISRKNLALIQPRLADHVRELEKELKEIDAAYANDVSPTTKQQEIERVVARGELASELSSYREVLAATGHYSQGIAKAMFVKPKEMKTSLYKVGIAVVIDGEIATLNRQGDALVPANDLTGEKPLKMRVLFLEKVKSLFSPKKNSCSALFS